MSTSCTHFPQEEGAVSIKQMRASLLGTGGAKPEPPGHWELSWGGNGPAGGPLLTQTFLERVYILAAWDTPRNKTAAELTLAGKRPERNKADKAVSWAVCWPGQVL